MKRYKLWEVIKMFSENKSLKFKCDKGIIEYNGGYITWEQGCLLAIMEDTQEYEWELIQEPVTFEEVLNSDKKCKVEHKLIDLNLLDEIHSDDNTTLNDFENLRDEEFMNFHNLLSVLPWILNNKEFKTVIKEGKWYLED